MSPRTLTTKLSLAAAFGLTSLGAIAVAGATPATPEAQAKAVPIPYTADDVGYDDEPTWDDVPADPDYDLDSDGVLENAEIDYRRHDRDRDGVLDRGERAAYWNHAVATGKLGPDLTRADRAHLARIAYLVDRDGDGRLTRPERATLSRLLRARKIFTNLDRNDDDTLTRREAGLVRYAPYDRHYRRTGGRGDWNGFYWSPFRRHERTRPNNWIAARFDTLDRNDNGRVSWGEIESHFLARLGRF